MSEVLTGTEQNFESVVLGSNRPVLVDFWAEWCQPCRRMEPVLKQLAAEVGNAATVVKVNVDEQRGLSAAYQVMALPALLVFKDGKKVKEFLGVKDKNTLLSALQSAECGEC